MLCVLLPNLHVVRIPKMIMFVREFLKSLHRIVISSLKTHLILFFLSSSGFVKFHVFLLSFQNFQLLYKFTIILFLVIFSNKNKLMYIFFLNVFFVICIGTSFGYVNYFVTSKRTFLSWCAELGVISIICLVSFGEFSWFFFQILKSSGGFFKVN